MLTQIDYAAIDEALHSELVDPAKPTVFLPFYDSISDAGSSFDSSVESSPSLSSSRPLTDSDDGNNSEYNDYAPQLPAVYSDNLSGYFRDIQESLRPTPESINPRGLIDEYLRRQHLHHEAQRLEQEHQLLNPYAHEFVPYVYHAQPQFLQQQQEYAYYEEPPMFSTSPLQASAPPFIPQHRQQQPVELPPPSYPWLPAFSAGACTSAGPQFSIIAIEIVNLGTWSSNDPAELAALAQHFVWKASSGITPEIGGIAPFARTVYRKFKSLKDENLADAFLFYLGECIVGTFGALWKSDNDTSVVNVVRSGSNEPHSIISSAVALASFTGSLFAHNILPLSSTRACLTLLLHELHSLEHLQAIYEFVSSAGKKLWRNPDSNDDVLEKFLGLFCARAIEAMRFGSLFKPDCSRRDAENWVLDVVEIVRSSVGAGTGTIKATAKVTTELEVLKPKKQVRFKILQNPDRHHAI